MLAVLDVEEIRMPIRKHVVWVGTKNLIGIRKRLLLECTDLLHAGEQLYLRGKSILLAGKPRIGKWLQQITEGQLLGGEWLLRICDGLLEREWLDPVSEGLLLADRRRWLLEL